MGRGAGLELASLPLLMKVLGQSQLVSREKVHHNQDLEKLSPLLRLDLCCFHKLCCCDVAFTYQIIQE